MNITKFLLLMNNFLIKIIHFISAEIIWKKNLKNFKLNKYLIHVKEESIANKK